MDFDEFKLRWVHFCDYVPVKFLDENTIYFGHGSYIEFLNVKTLKESYYSALGPNNGGDGIECYTNHKSVTIVAFAEKCLRPRIIFFKYPHLNVIKCLNDCTDSKFISIEFTSTDFLLTLSDVPKFEIVIWNWYNSEKIITIESKYEFEYQMLRVNNLLPILFVQFSHDSTDLIIMWDFISCQSTNYLRRNPVKFPYGKILEIKWCSEINKVFILNDVYKLYSIHPISHHINVELENDSNEVILDFILHANTVIISTNSRKLIFYAYQNKKWIIKKEINLNYLIKKLYYDYNLLLGYDTNGILMKLDTNPIILKEFAMFIQNFELINPDGDYFLILNSSNNLILYSKINGFKLSSVELVSKVIVFKSNPVFAYVMVACSNGYVNLIKILDNSLHITSTIKLLDSDIDYISYDDNGQYLIAVSKCANCVFLMNQNYDTVQVLNVIKLINESNFFYIFQYEQSLYLIIILYNQILKYEFPISDFKRYRYSEYLCNKDYKNIVFCQHKGYLIAACNNSIHFDIINLNNMELIQELITMHLKPDICIVKSNNIFISYSTDNLTILYEKFNFGKIWKQFSSLNRFDTKIKKVIIDHKNQNLIIYNHNLLISITMNAREDDLGIDQKWICNQEKRILEFDAINVNWIDCYERENYNKELILNKEIIVNINTEYKKFQNEIDQMLEINENLDAFKKLDIFEFYLDVDERKVNEDFVHKKCEFIKTHSEYLINEYERAWLWIKTNCWDTCVCKKKLIKKCYKKSSVENYTISSENFPKQFSPSLDQNLNFDGNIDHFWNNFPVENHDKVKEFFSGTTVDKFFNNLSNRYHQFEINTMFQKTYMSLIFQLDNHNLRLHFNEKFEDLIKEKSKVINQIKIWNIRLRNILSELNQDPALVIDPKFELGENEDDVISVTDTEIKSKPFITKDKKKLEQGSEKLEKLKLLSETTDFRDRALQNMMFGVLETRWEDEIKKDIPLPKCMIEKNPQEYTSEDYQEILLYEEKVQALQAERLRYKNILTEEYNKLSKKIMLYVQSFNSKVESLVFYKSKIESMILQNDLFRYRWILLENLKENLLIEQENIFKKIDEVDNEIKSLQNQIANMLKEINNCSEINKDIINEEKRLDRQIKKEFSNLISSFQEQIFKLYKKNPKVSLKHVQFQSVLDNLSQSILSNENNYNDLMNPTCIEFLHQINCLDSALNTIKFLNEYNIKILSTYRKKRLQVDIKLRMIHLEKSIGEDCLKYLQEHLTFQKSLKEQLEDEMNSLKKKRINDIVDMQIQVVFKQGIVECPISGKITDFDDAVLINKQEIIKLNQFIIQEGKLKLKALKKALNLKRVLLMKKWEHENLKMQLVDVNYELGIVDNTQIDKDVEEYINLKKHKVNEKKFRSIEEEELNLEFEQRNILNEIQIGINDFQNKIDDLEKSNRRLDFKISQLNLDYNDKVLNLSDDKINIKSKFTNSEKLEMIQKRKKLMKRIQNQNELLTEIEMKIQQFSTIPSIK